MLEPTGLDLGPQLVFDLLVRLVRFDLDPVYWLLVGIWLVVWGTWRDVRLVPPLSEREELKTDLFTCKKSSNF